MMMSNPITSNHPRRSGISATSPLVPCELIKVELDKSHLSTGHPEGSYAAVVMPRYLDSVARLCPAPDSSGLVAGGKRMIQALEYLHGKGLVHMDIKVSAQWRFLVFIWGFL